MTTSNDNLGKTLGRLRDAVDEAGGLLRSLENQLASSTAPEATAAHGHIEKLRQELEETQRDRRELTELMIDAERQSSRLMSLYVALHQLHSTLDPQEVYAAIAEIAIDLLGAEQFALLLHDSEAGETKVALARGLEHEAPPTFSEDHYLGGDEQIDASLVDGQLRIGDAERSNSLAVVPLRVKDRIIGALVILRVFSHKGSSLNQDRDLLDLLSVHASSALLAAESYSATDRKLRTLKELISLLPSS